MPDTYRSAHTGSIADLMRQQGQVRARQAAAIGQAEAQRAATSGNIWGSAIQNIGQGVSGTLADLAQARRGPTPDDQYKQAQAAKIRAELAQGDETAKRTRIGDLAAVIAAGGYKPEMAEPLFRVIASESPEYAEPLMRSLMEPAMLKQVTDQLMTLKPGYKAPEGFTLSEGQTRFGPTGESLATVPKSEPPPQPFTLTPGSKRYGPTGEVLAEVPAAERPEPNVTESQLAMMAAQGNQQAAAALAKLRSLRAPQTEPPLMPVVGPDGKTRYGTRAEARGQIVPSGQNKPATGLEKRALNFFNRAAQADADLEGLEAQVQSLNLPGQTYMEWAPNFMQTELGQQYTQAQRAFTEARLRKDSGAAIPEQEFANDRRTYFAQPGDSQETLEQKRRARAVVLASLGFESGQALGEFVGDADEARRVVEGYKARAAKPAAGALKIRMRAPDGSVQEVDPSLVKHYESLGAKVVK